MELDPGDGQRTMADGHDRAVVGVGGCDE